MKWSWPNSCICLEGLRRTSRNLTVASALDEIRTKLLLNTSVESHYYSSLFSLWHYRMQAVHSCDLTQNYCYCCYMLQNICNLFCPEHGTLWGAHLLHTPYFLIQLWCRISWAMQQSCSHEWSGSVKLSLFLWFICPYINSLNFIIIHLSHTWIVISCFWKIILLLSNVMYILFQNSYCLAVSIQLTSCSFLLLYCAM
jgi:hypothetical protein